MGDEYDWPSDEGGSLSCWQTGQTGRRVAFLTYHVEIHAVSSEMKRVGTATIPSSIEGREKGKKENAWRYPTISR